MIDKSVIKFVVSLLIVSALVEVVRNINEKAALALAGVIVIGILINNPLALYLIQSGSSKLRDVTE